MKKMVLVLTVILMTLMTACGASESKDVSEGGVVPPSAAPPSLGISVGSPPQEEGSYSEMTPADTSEERMIVRSGDMSLVVADIIQARDGITLLAEQSGGYVVSSSLYGEDENTRGRITIRVPDEEFSGTIAAIRELAVRVTSESTGSQDVTEEYTDLQSRLKNAEATEAQYLVILEKATDVEDILRVYDYLGQVRAEIEQLKGRIQYLERTAAMSLIAVRMEPESTSGSLVRPGWNMAEVFKSALRGMVIFGQVLGTIIIWLLIFSPLWGALVWLFIWWRRHRRKKKA